MSQQERWDVVLNMLNGPMKGIGEQKLRGPVVRIGANPGPGGFTLTGYRGLDARQCVVTVYSGGAASVAPVGTNQVRMAPHSNVNWRDLDPIPGPEYLSPGCAIHLGPVGRGATIEFVKAEKFGQWEQGQLLSEAADVGGQRSGAAGGPLPPASYDARRVDRVRSSTAPYWFLGCSSLGAVTTTVLVLIIGLWQVLSPDRKPPGPVEEGLEFYRDVDIAEFNDQDLMLLEGLEQGYYAFVAGPNIDAAGGAAKEEWGDPTYFDPMFMRFVTKSVNQHIRSWSFFRRLDAVHVEYGKVVLALRREGLPEVFAAIPYRESRYDADAQSVACAKGYWQFMPEVAYRVDRQSDITFRVKGCRFIGNDQLRWEPKALIPPFNVMKNADYVQDGQCMITTCDVDDRTRLEKSTDAAIYTLKEAWDDPLIRESGSAVQLVISSHNAGYDDSRFGRKKKFNVKTAYAAWSKKVGKDQGPYFTGQNIRCPNWDDGKPCGGAYMAETQHYAYNIVAQHLLAACYYGRNYVENPAFRPYRKFLGPEGYCDRMDIPTKEEVRAKK